MTSTAIKPTRVENFSEWYQVVIKEADLAEHAPVRGCMIIKPWGYAIWEELQRQLDAEIKRLGHENAYFPLLIPLSYFQREAEHIAGFAKECAVVTHSKITIDESGVLKPESELEEPYIVRPTSELIIGHAFSNWIRSYRDLPLLINQWANIMRWEMRTRLFLRTSEFLWQEGHTAHETPKEAEKEVKDILDMYIQFLENVLAMPVIAGRKTEAEKFPGAVYTYTMEAMMQDRKSLQAGTSHYLGQTFSRAMDIKFVNRDNEEQFAYTTSWGVSTRLIGGLIMVHGDDDGLRLPPPVAGKHIVVLPVLTGSDRDGEVIEYSEKVVRQIRDEALFRGAPIRVALDKRDLRGGEKNWQWVKRGVPIRVEVGPRDIDNKQLVFRRRDKPNSEKAMASISEFISNAGEVLEEIHSRYLLDAKSFLKSNIRTDIKSKEDLVAFFTPKNRGKPEIHGGFVVAKWCEDPESEKELKRYGLSIRCVPFEQSGTSGKCVLTGNKATLDVLIAKSY